MYAGSQFLTDNNSFELLYDIDFASNFNIANNIDRTKVPVYVNGILSAYKITKTGIVIAGTTRVLTQTIKNTKSFYQITLPEDNVLSIDSVIHKNGTTFATLPTINEFNSSTNKWYEVPSLAENKQIKAALRIPVFLFRIQQPYLLMVCFLGIILMLIEDS